MRFFVVRLRTVLLAGALLFLVLLLLLFGDRLAQTASATLTQQLPLIILDAGHGGEDGGAVAADGTKEKDLNLALTLKLRDLLETLGLRTVLSRTEDRLHYPADASSMRSKKAADLRYRLELTQKNPDSVLLSVHMNQFSVSRYDGAQVFYSGNHPYSALLAQDIQDAIVRQTQPDNTRQIKQSGKEIFLLNQTQVPAVMVECGFLSNPQELEKLKNDSYQQQLASAIAEGLLNFLNNRT